MQVQLVFLLLVVTFFLALHVYKEPYAHLCCQKLETYGLVSTLVSVWVGLMLQVSKDQARQQQESNSPFSRSDKTRDALLALLVFTAQGTFYAYGIYVLFWVSIPHWIFDEEEEEDERKEKEHEEDQSAKERDLRAQVEAERARIAPMPDGPEKGAASAELAKLEAKLTKVQKGTEALDRLRNKLAVGVIMSFTAFVLLGMFISWVIGIGFFLLGVAGTIAWILKAKGMRRYVLKPLYERCLMRYAPVFCCDPEENRGYLWYHEKNDLHQVHERAKWAHGILEGNQMEADHDAKIRKEFSGKIADAREYKVGSIVRHDTRGLGKIFSVTVGTQYSENKAAVIFHDGDVHRYDLKDEEILQKLHLVMTNGSWYLDPCPTWKYVGDGAVEP